MQDHLGLDAAMTSADAQATVAQGLLLAGQVQVTPAAHAALEVLAIVADQHVRVAQTPEPARAQPHLQHQGIGLGQRLAQPQAALLDPAGELRGARGKRIAIIIAGPIEQVVGKPGFVRDPEQHQQHGHQPDADRHPGHQQPRECGQQGDALVAPMLPEQLLLA